MTSCFDCGRKLYDNEPVKAEDAQAPAAQGVSSYPQQLSDFQEGQWWIKELDAMVEDVDIYRFDQKRAVAVVHHMLRSISARESGVSEPVEQPVMCPNCDGSGTMKVMSSAGPDAYEVDECCNHCGGHGDLFHAYEGVLDSLRRAEARYRDAEGRLWGIKNVPGFAEREGYTHPKPGGDAVREALLSEDGYMPVKDGEADDNFVHDEDAPEWLTGLVTGWEWTPVTRQVFRRTLRGGQGGGG